MSKRPNPHVAREVPLCVGSVYEQVIVKGASKYSLEWIPLDEATGLPAEDVTAKKWGLKSKLGKIYAPKIIGWGTIDTPADKSMLSFLACRDKDRDGAYNLWQEVRKLRRTDAEYELEAQAVLVAALHSSSLSPAQTRTELKKLDKAVEDAAKALCKALSRHDKFGREPSASNWSEADGRHMAELLHAIASFGGWKSTQQNSRQLFDLVCATAPTMVNTLEVLAGRAAEEASKRFDAKKGRKTTGEAHDTQFIRSILAGLITRNPGAAADHIARIVFPIVDKAFGMPVSPIRVDGKESKTFARCKKLAQEIRNDWISNGAIDTPPILTGFVCFDTSSERM